MSCDSGCPKRVRPRWGGLAAHVALLSLLMLLGACRSAPPLPEHPWEGPEAVLTTLRERVRDLQGLSAECHLRLRDPDHGSVSLDGALALQDPGSVRLQTWKFDQTVFDLVLHEGRLSLWSHARLRETTDPLLDDLAAQLAEQGRTDLPLPTPLTLGTLLAPPTDGIRLLASGAGKQAMVVRWPLQAATSPHSAEVEAHIDPTTRTLRELHFLDPQGQVAQKLVLDRYESVGDRLWPTRLRGTGRLNATVRLWNIEPNPDLPPAAFTPPRGARHLP